MTALAQLGPYPQTMTQFLQENAGRYGDAAALLYKPGFRYERWSYARLLDEALRCVALIRSRGLKEGDRAMICGPNSPQWVIAYFACALAGVIAVPLDVRSAHDFAERVAAKTTAKLAFLSRRNPTPFEDVCPATIALEDLDALLKEQPPAKPADVRPDDLLQIMFTSGTTGEPKGVMLTHANLMANLAQSRAHVPGDSGYRLLSILPLSHMFEQMGGLLLPLSCGANVTYPTSLQPQALTKVMQDRRVNLMLVVPQVLTLFMNGIEREVQRWGRQRIWDLMIRLGLKLPFGARRLLFGSVHKRFGGSLAVFFTGGAPLDPEVGRKWEALGVRVIQGYGATEASPTISAHTLREPRYDSVGRPVPGLEVRLDPDGELLIRGPNISQGYWQAPEQTAAAYTDGWYRTGDLCSIDEHGFIHIRGRKKDMIALASGQKVFPEDIENVLTKHPLVQDAAVVGLLRANGPEVHAALILRDGAQAAGVVAWANRQLADHQQARGYTLWPDDDFPRTHTLKVRKNVVLDKLLGRAEAAPVAAAPATTAQDAGPDALIAVLAEISGIEAPKIEPDMTLGGDLNLDSLKRVELLSLMEERMGVSLDDAQVDGETTVLDLRSVAAGEGSESAPLVFPRWARSWWCLPLRSLLQAALLLPAIRRLYAIEVHGLENLRGLRAPVIFVANHNLLLDSAVLIEAMPRHVRRRLAIAAAADLWRNRFWGVVNPLLGNAFPFSREGSIRPSLENLVRVLDEGWHILIYPEGRLTIGGPMQPFKAGIGMLAAGVHSAIVPIRYEMHGDGRPKYVPWRSRGRLTVYFGEPMTFDPGDSYVDATARIEEAVSALGKSAMA